MSSKDWTDVAALAFGRLMHSDDVVTPSKDFTSLPSREAGASLAMLEELAVLSSKITRARAAVYASRRYWKGAASYPRANSHLHVYLPLLRSCPSPRVG